MTIELSVGERLKAIEENLWLVDTEEILRTRQFPVYVEGHGIYAIAKGRNISMAHQAIGVPA